jgi:hypothetical protein
VRRSIMTAAACAVAAINIAKLNATILDTTHSVHPRASEA